MLCLGEGIGRVGAVAVVRWWKWAIWVKTFEDVWKRLAACDLKLNCHQDDQGELVEESMGMDYGDKYLLGRGCCCHIHLQIIGNETSTHKSINQPSICTV